MLSQELRSQMQYVNVLVIGAGPAGMAAAIAAREAGVSNLLVLERENDMAAFCANASITDSACTASRRS